MSLPVTNLDDRTAQQLVDEAKRMIPELFPEWTNHNVADPGVALIELFAWMTEMSLFRLNQVPDNFYLRMLNLLGFERFPASAARAELTFWVTGPRTEPVPVPVGTQVTSRGELGEPRVFTTLADLVIRPPLLRSAMTFDGTDFVDVWDKLRIGAEPVPCFPRLDKRNRGGEQRAVIAGPVDAFYLGFERSLAGSVISLAFKAQAEGIGVRPSLPPLKWEVSAGDGRWLDAVTPDLSRRNLIADGTGGLNKDGSLILMIPAEHRSVPAGGTDAFWLRAVLLPTQGDRATYSRSPEIKGVAAVAIGGTTTAEHSELILGEELGISNGKPGQQFTAANTPVLPPSDDEYVQVVVEGEVQKDWERRIDFATSGKDDRHYTWDLFTGTVAFGPKIRYPVGVSTNFGPMDVQSNRTHVPPRSVEKSHGAVPPEGAVIRLTSYRTGGGELGNGPAGMLTGLRTTVKYVQGVENLTPARGGVDAESVEESKVRGPQSIRAGDRAVTESDFVRLTHNADPRIARVRCVEPTTPHGPVRILIVPSIDVPPNRRTLRDFAIPEDMAHVVEEHLDERRVMGARIEIGAPRYQGVSVAALVIAKDRPPDETDTRRNGSDVTRNDVLRQRVLDALYGFVSPVATDHRDGGWEFGEDLTSVQIASLLKGVEGVARVEDVLLFQYDLRTNKHASGPGRRVLALQPNTLFLSAKNQVVVR